MADKDRKYDLRILPNEACGLNVLTIKLASFKAVPEFWDVVGSATAAPS